MKTYRLLLTLGVLALLGCSKSEGFDETSVEENVIGNASYNLVLRNNGQLSFLNVYAEKDHQPLVESNSKLSTTVLPDLSYWEDNKWVTFERNAYCKYSVSVFDLSSSQVQNYSLFKDISDCSVTVQAILTVEDKLYLAYDKEETSKVSNSYVRVYNDYKANDTFYDIALTHPPKDMAFANDRLFVLTLDILDSGKNALSVINTKADIIIHNQLLSFDARRIFRGPQESIIVSYDHLHTTINSTTLSNSNTMYGEGIEPNFKQASSLRLDSEGKLYYDMPGGAHSYYPTISAVYDFEANSAVLYAFENFLTEAQRNFEYEIERTTMVSYDEENNLLLIGYEKKDKLNKGGLIRLKPAPNPKFIDNINLSGIPHAIYIQ